MAEAATRPGLLQSRLMQLVSLREPPKTICPSEVPRSMSTSELEELGASGWRDLMDETRAIVFQLRDQGVLEILQRGHVLSNDATVQNVKGPLRVRKKP